MDLEFREGQIVHLKGKDANPIQVRILNARLEAQSKYLEGQPTYRIREVKRKYFGTVGARSIVESKYFEDIPKDSWENASYRKLSPDYTHLLSKKKKKRRPKHVSTLKYHVFKPMDNNTWRQTIGQVWDTANEAKEYHNALYKRGLRAVGVEAFIGYTGNEPIMTVRDAIAYNGVPSVNSNNNLN